MASAAAKPKTILWDPFSLPPLTSCEPHKFMARIMKEVKTINTDPLPPGIYMHSDPDDMTTMFGLVVGVEGTPYAGGFFFFVMKCPSDYPFVPPLVRHMTTDAGRVRFNPNLYNNGKICLSILGTWDGPLWSAGQTLVSVLLSIQTIMNDKPYHNEPSFEKERTPGDVERYNHIIRHETLRVAVCGMLENETLLAIPKPFLEVMESKFLENYDSYIAFALEKMPWDGSEMKDPFRETRGKFQYNSILTRLRALHTKLTGIPFSELPAEAMSPKQEFAGLDGFHNSPFTGFPGPFHASTLVDMLPEEPKSEPVEPSTLSAVNPFASNSMANDQEASTIQVTSAGKKRASLGKKSASAGKANGATSTMVIKTTTKIGSTNITTTMTSVTSSNKPATKAGKVAKSATVKISPLKKVAAATKLSAKSMNSTKSATATKPAATATKPGPSVKSGSSKKSPAKTGLIVKPGTSVKSGAVVKAGAAKKSPPKKGLAMKPGTKPKPAATAAVVPPVAKPSTSTGHVRPVTRSQSFGSQPKPAKK